MGATCSASLAAASDEKVNGSMLFQNWPSVGCAIVILPQLLPGQPAVTVDDTSTMNIVML